MKKTAPDKLKKTVVTFQKKEVVEEFLQEKKHPVGDQDRPSEIVSSTIPLYDIPNEHRQIGNLKTIVFNVGQGDHCLLQFPDGKYGIIDFYFETTNSSLFEPPAITYFRNLPEEEKLTIAFICITHTDYDHLKGVKESVDYLLSRPNTTIENIWLPGADDIQDALHSLLDENEKAGEALYSLFTSKEIQEIKSIIGKLTELNKTLEDLNLKAHSWPIYGFDDILHHDIVSTIKIECLGPLFDQIKKYDKKIGYHILNQIIKNIGNKDSGSDDLTEEQMDHNKRKGKKAVQKSPANPNAISTILRIQYDQHQLLFAGDITLESWEECLKEFKRRQKKSNLSDLNFNFIKGTHHGSKYNSSPVFWSQVFPDSGEVYVTFSAGKGRKNYQHPDSETYAHMDEAKIAKGKTSLDRRKTNKCIQCLKKNCEQLLEKTDLFAFQEEVEKTKSEESKKRKTILDQLLKEELIFLDPKLELDNKSGLLGFHYEFKKGENREVEFKMILSEGMKRYENCLFGGTVENECPHPVLVF